MAYDWPGNVPELENCLECASRLSSGRTLHEEDLPTQVRNGVSPLSANAPGKTNSGHETRVMLFAEIEKRAIMNAITQADGDKLLAARLLGIGKTLFMASEMRPTRPSARPIFSTNGNNATLHRNYGVHWRIFLRHLR
jgi:DNA-binding NtrC family response regulator